MTRERGGGFSPAAVPVLMPLLLYSYNRHLHRACILAADNIIRVVFVRVLILMNAKCLIAAPWISDAQPLIRAPWPTVIVKPKQRVSHESSGRSGVSVLGAAEMERRAERSRAKPFDAQKKALPLVPYALATGASQRQHCVLVS